MPWIGGAIAAGGSILGGLMGSGAANSAANTQADATRAGIDENRREYDLARSDQAPYRNAGASALQRLQMLLGMGNPSGSGPSLDSVASSIGSALPFYDKGNSKQTVGDFLEYAKSLNANPAQMDQWSWSPEMKASVNTLLPQAQAAMAGADAPANPEYGSLNKKFSIADFWNDPVVAASYQSGLDLGTKALKNAAPLTTGLDSGAAYKELTKFGTDYTGNMAAGSQQRYVGDQNTTYNRLMGIVTGAGMPATNATTQAGMQTGANVSNLYSAQGNAAGAAKIAGANSWGNGVNSVSNWWNQQQMLNRFAPQGGGGMNTNFNGGYSGNPTYNYDSYGTTG